MDISESCLDEERTVTMIEDIVETDETVVNHPQHAHSPEDCAQEPNNLPPLRTFAPIVSAHPYCARESHATSCHVMHRARALRTKMNK